MKTELGERRSEVPQVVSDKPRMLNPGAQVLVITKSVGWVLRVSSTL